MTGSNGPSENQVSEASRLLLLFSRLELDSAQREIARSLVSRITDWSAFSELAATHFLLPMTYRHLTELEHPEFSEQVRQQMRQTVLAIVANTLQVAAVQRDFISNTLLPFGAPFALVKGQALSARYYANSAVRFCRDIDVLVPEKALLPLVEFAMAQGYRVQGYDGPPSRNDLKAMVRYLPDVSIMSPSGVPIELHQQLDKSGLVFKTEKLLERAVRINIDGVSVPMLSTPDHFVFVCLHHTRHLWSHLHWLTDIDAMMRHPEFRKHEVEAQAERMGLASTVEAVFGLHAGMAAVQAKAPIVAPGHAQDLVDACLAHLANGPRMEVELRKLRPYSDFAFEWQADAHPRITGTFWRFLNLMQPNMSDYENQALPAYLHWLYYLIRPISGLKRRLFKLKSKR